MNTETTEVAYSTNDEDFNYTSLDELLSYLEADGELYTGKVYYEIDTAPVDLSSYLSASRLLDQAEDQLYGDIGEAAEDAFYASKEAIFELQTYLEAWTDKHLSKARYWQCVGKSRKRVITEKDIANYET